MGFVFETLLATSKNPRSTVGTITEIYDYLRLLYARIGLQKCYQCHQNISKQSSQKIIDNILKFPNRSKLYIMSPVIKQQKGEHKNLIQNLLSQGFVRARINNKIVNLINQAGGKAISLPGHKKSLIEVTPLEKEMGFVGKPKKIKIKIIKNILKKNYIPIIASLGFKGKKVFNINADTVAGELASSLSATRFYFITNIKGVMDKNNKLIKEITPKKAKELIKKNIIKGGMIPKVETCLNAVKKSAKAAVILDGRSPKLLLKEIFTKRGVGTLIGKK